MWINKNVKSRKKGYHLGAGINFLCRKLRICKFSFAALKRMSNNIVSPLTLKVIVINRIFLKSSYFGNLFSAN